jgi:hypothetical protein
MHMEETEVMQTLAALNTLTDEKRIHALTDLHWWTLAGLIARWLDDPESGKLLKQRSRGDGVTKPETIASVIGLIAMGYLKLEVSYPEETLTTEPLSECARFGYRIYVPDSAPEDEPRVSSELADLIWSKVQLFADADEHRRKGQLPDAPRQGS